MMEATRQKFPGSTDCRPVVFGSLPKTSLNDTFIQRVELPVLSLASCQRLQVAACAPRNSALTFVIRILSF
jgi:hypothetical protein